jgi:hypothetical protein
MDHERGGWLVRPVAITIIMLALVLGNRRAVAYPQFQLSKDQTCNSCHLSPAGGGLLSENGLSVAETNATHDVVPEAAHGALVGPNWLEVSAELRGAAGMVDDRGAHADAFPMQADAEAAVTGHGFTVFAILGAQEGNGGDALSYVESRQHWVMWQSNPGSTSGLYIRIGRFMPVYTLRFVEHTIYTQRYGQAPLYGEAYGAAVEYVTGGWEAHVTAFVHDPIQYSAENGDGVAIYTEARPTKSFSVGLEGRYAHSDLDARLAGGATAKLWIAPGNVLVEAESQVIHQTFDTGGSRDQLVNYLMGSWFFHPGWMLDVGLGEFDEDTNVPRVDLECIDANLHWFATSHWELLFTGRIQSIALGAGGPNSGYALLQFHYRL